MEKISFGSFRSTVWFKVATMTGLLFFIFLADGILSDWIPAYMQNSLGSPLIMGWVMAFSSVVGLGADILFPQLLRGVTVKVLLVLSIISAILFSGSLLLTTWFPILLVFLISMAIWGVFYEFLGFANQQFVVETAGVNERSKVWAMMGIFKNLAYFLGPIIGTWILAAKGDRTVVLVASGLTLVAYVVFGLLKIPEKKVEIEVKEINLLKEISYWRVLFVHVWPMILASLFLGILDATFWTTGTVLSENLAKQNWWGGFFLPMYMFPPLFVGLIVMKWGISTGKKKWAEIFMLLAGLILAGLALSDNVPLMIIIVFLSSTMLSVAYPLIDAVYSDVLARLGHERKHLIGLSSSVISLAYIIGPIIAGALATEVGEKMTFVVMGGLLAVISIILLAVTPRKLRMPQQEIATWDRM